MMDREEFFKIYDEDEAAVITALCLVAPTNEVTELIKKSCYESLQKCLKKLQWITKENDTFFKEKQARIKELTEEIKTELLNREK